MDSNLSEVINTKVLAHKNIIEVNSSNNLNENKNQNHFYYDKINENEDSDEDSNEDNKINNLLFKQSQQIKDDLKNEVPNLLEIIKNNMVKSSPYISNNIVSNPLYKNVYYSLNNDINNDINNNNSNLNIDHLKEEIENENKILKTCLKNNGKTYYLNSILQNLGNIEYLKNYFLKGDVVEYLEKNEKQYPLSYVTQRIFHHFYITRDEMYSIKPFSIILAYLNLIYASKENKNVNECFIFILNTLHNELNKIKNPPDKKNYNKTDKNEVINYGIMNIKNAEDSIISDIFNWYKIIELHCIQCEQISFDFYSCNIFQLNLLEFKKNIDRNNFNIYDIINYELRKKEESICEYCKNKTIINKKINFYSSPKIFVFFLNKGDYNEELFDIKFVLEEVINLNKFIENQKSPKKYELIGIISTNINDKIYHSFCKSFEDQQWYHFNDETVMKIKDKQVIFNNIGGEFIPNILFYRAID